MGLLAISVIGGGWTLAQSQFAGVRELIDLHEKQDRAADEALRQQVMIARDQYALNFANATKATEALESEVKARIADIHQELRHDFPTQSELRQIELRIDSLAHRLEILEATRPTTGEVGIRSEALEKRIEVLTQRLNLLTERTTIPK